MINRVKGSVAPNASEVALDNGDSVQDFYDEWTAEPAGQDFDLANADVLWTGEETSVDLAVEAPSTYDPSRVKFVLCDLKLSGGGTVGSFWVAMFPQDHKIFWANSLSTPAVDTEFAMLSSAGSLLTITGYIGRSGESQDFKITEVRQAA